MWPHEPGTVSFIPDNAPEYRTVHCSTAQCGTVGGQEGGGGGGGATGWSGTVLGNRRPVPCLLGDLLGWKGRLCHDYGAGFGGLTWRCSPSASCTTSEVECMAQGQGFPKKKKKKSPAGVHPWRAVYFPGIAPMAPCAMDDNLHVVATKARHDWGWTRTP